VNAIAPPSGAPASGPALDNRRVLAGLIDVAVIAAGVFVLATLLGMALGGDVKLGPPMIAIALAWGLYYYFALESGDGQTLGKKVMKLRVVRADGGTTSMREIAVRTVVRLADFPLMYLVGLVTMLVTGNRRQRLGDIAAGTVVVDASAAPAPAAAVVAAAPPAVEEPRIDETAPERPADAPPMGEPSFPVAKSPADVGDPLPGVTPEPQSTPEVQDFTPFEEPVTEEPSEPAAYEPVEPAPDEPSEPAAYEPSEPVQPEPSEPAAYEPVEPAPDEPSEPAAYEPSEPVQPEPSEPAAHEPSEPVQPEPSEPAAEEAAEPPAPEQAAEPHVEVVSEPADDPGLQPPTQLYPSGAEEEGADGAEAEEEGADGSGADEAGPQQEGDDVSVRSVETVSAMDLIMGEDAEDEDEADEQHPGAGPAGA
jgi:uncharacterized RDD family membrane protein YckC